MLPRNHILDGGQNRMSPFAASRGDKVSDAVFYQITFEHIIDDAILDCFCT